MKFDGTSNKLKTDINLNLLLTCKTIYQEAWKIPLESNRIVIGRGKESEILRPEPIDPQDLKIARFQGFNDDTSLGFIPQNIACVPPFQPLESWHLAVKLLMGLKTWLHRFLSVELELYGKLFHRILDDGPGLAVTLGLPYEQNDCLAKVVNHECIRKTSYTMIAGNIMVMTPLLLEALENIETKNGAIEVKLGGIGGWEKFAKEKTKGGGRGPENATSDILPRDCEIHRFDTELRDYVRGMREVASHKGIVVLD